MEDFKLIIDKVFSFLSIDIPIFGYSFSLLTIILSNIILSIAINFICVLFGGKD